MNLSRDIRDYLIVKRAVSLPGLGNLYLNHVPARLDKTNKILKAPTCKILFDDKPSNNEDIVDHLVAKYDISKKAAKREFKNYTFGIMNMLLNYGNAELEGIGILSQKNNEEIVFDQDENQSFLLSKYLPQIKAIPIKRTADILSHSVSSVQKEAAASSKKMKYKVPDWVEYAIPFIGAALIILVGYFGWKAYNHFTSKSNEKSTELLEDHPRLNKDPDSVLTGEIYSKEDRDDSFNDESSIENEIGDEFSDPESSLNPDSNSDLKSNLISGADQKKSSDSVPKADPETGGKEKVDEDTDLIDVATEELVEVPETDANNSVSENLKSKPPFDSKDNYSGVGFSSPNLKPFQPEPFKCVIVVGSFKRKSYVNAMISKLQKLDLPHYTQTHNEFTRVGVLIECRDEAEVYAHLKKIKENVEQKAWILN